MMSYSLPQLATLISMFFVLALTFSAPASALNINTATAAELTELKGVGPKRAQAIVRYREKHGPFQDREALLDVPGVGKKVLKDNLAIIELEARNTTASK
ncbi:MULTISPECIES: helix-hairpin-helix domain-containing protein [Spongiibacter]|uniref:ComEA family DNA-binding protein n=2 Tax=Spongiibacteraceae TaxID=1706375 RepID=UPI0019617E9B|nr:MULTISPECIES: helix-hairpin-helix domain-containing protein [Spongiibacter]MBM7423627.1 competence protein ComEA [Spongiibacter marinus]|tara:strand:+ start:3733 stop:4032 length:300 start_codon:yes stop_codon:yes gene_type:complete